MSQVLDTTKNIRPRMDSALADGEMLAELQNSQEMAEQGAARARRSQLKLVELGRQADTTSTRHIIKSLIRGVSSLASERIEDGVGVPGRGKLGECVLRDVTDLLGADAVAFTALRTVFNQVPMLSGSHKHAKLTTIGSHVGTAIADEYHWALFEKLNPRLALDMTDRWTRESYRSMVREKHARRAVAQDTDIERLDTKQKVSIGIFMLDVIRETAPLFQEYTRREGHRTIRCLGVTPYMSSLIERTVRRYEELYTTYMPTLVAPRQWSTGNNLYGGGYWSQCVAPYGILKRVKPAELIELEAYHKLEALD